MFTGIMKSVGRVVGTTPLGGGVRFRVEAPDIARDVNFQDRVLMNGVSQTVVGQSETEFIVETSAEALSKTTMGDLHIGSQVNLELALRLADRLGTHLVQGHIDCIGSVVVIERRPSSWWLSVEFPASFGKYVVPAGSVAVDGISLTVAAAEGNRFMVSINPEHLARATLARAVLGTRVNIEFDLIGKYVEKILKEGGGEEPDLELRERLRSWGYRD